MTAAAAARLRPARARAVYLLVAALLVVVYAAVAPLLWTHRDWVDDGPLNFHHPKATAALSDGTSLDEIEQRCFTAGQFDHGSQYTIKIVGGHVSGADYYACYQVKSDGAVFKAVVVDADGIKAPDRIAKQGGAWRWIGTVKTTTELALGGAALAVLLAMYYLYYRRARPGPPQNPKWWQSSTGNGILGALSILPFTLPFRRKESRGRRLRLLFLYIFGFAGAVIVALFIQSISDRTSAVTLGLLVLALLFGWLGGRTLLRPAGFGAPDGAAAGWTVQQWPANYPAQMTGPMPGGQPSANTPSVSAPPPRPSRIRPAGSLPTFAQVGGMAALKDELSDTLGLLLAFSGEAEAYRITFNGILLHGPPGVGKTFFAQATAGEFGLSFLPVSTGELISKYVGESSQNLKEVFAEAARNVPCLLFFDEFDSIAERRDDGIGEESKRVVNQLLQSLEEWRSTSDLVVMAATNHLDRLDPAVVRAGRFDRHIRVDLPDREARQAILSAQLAGRPLAPGADIADIAERMAGRTPATIARVANAAAMTAFQQSTETAAAVPISNDMLRTAVTSLGGKDRPSVEDWTWDRLILDAKTTTELRQVQALVTDPDLARNYGVQPPSGLLLAGPPGTGKTTVARVFAAQAGCSFYPQTAADLTSKWVGESEASVVRLFARARDNAPSIIFIDEIDAIATTRSELGSGVLDRTLTQLLTEIDGMTEQRGVFVMAATNRPDVLDPALLRGGRLSRTIWIPLPDPAARRQLLGLFCQPMPLSGVDLDALATETDGFSGADLEALCQQAALQAMLDAQQDLAGAPHRVTAAAFARALADHPKITERPTATAPPPDYTPGGYL